MWANRSLGRLPALSEPEIVIIFAIEKWGWTVSQGLDPKDFKDYSALGLGWSLVGTLIFCVVGGVLLDQVFDTTPWLTLTGVAIGLISSGYLLYELTLINRSDRQAGPIGRRLAARTHQRRGDTTDNRVQ